MAVRTRGTPDTVSDSSIGRVPAGGLVGPEARRVSTATVALRHVLGRDWATAWLFLAPCLLVLVGLIAYPFFSAILLSFQAKLVGSPAVWVGLGNYQDLFTG